VNHFVALLWHIGVLLWRLGVWIFGYPQSLRPAKVPNIIYVYGVIIKIVITLYMLIGLLFAPRYSFIVCIPTLFIGLFIFRIGQGLQACERQSVYDLSIICGLVQVGGVCLITLGWVNGEKQFVMPLVVYSALTFLLFPPVIIAFCHWSAFKRDDRPPE
jgi:hypothetical protein